MAWCHQVPNNVDPIVWCHMAPPGHNELRVSFAQTQLSSYMHISRTSCIVSPWGHYNIIGLTKRCKITRISWHLVFHISISFVPLFCNFVWHMRKRWLGYLQNFKMIKQMRKRLWKKKFSRFALFQQFLWIFCTATIPWQLRSPWQLSVLYLESRHPCDC